MGLRLKWEVVVGSGTWDPRLLPLQSVAPSGSPVGLD